MLNFKHSQKFLQYTLLKFIVLCIENKIIRLIIVSNEIISNELNIFGKLDKWIWQFLFVRKVNLSIHWNTMFQHSMLKHSVIC